MNPVVGRKKEQALLETIFQSSYPELIALYGRRRVGKTFLILNTFTDREDTTFFSITGMKEGKIKRQLENFKKQVGAAFYRPDSRLEVPDNWFTALDILAQEIKASKSGKIVLFFDEFPWLVTKKSDLLIAFEYFWNEHASHDSRVKLVICGSSASWMLKNIINNRGAFYNRVTRKIHLEPYTLHQTRDFFASRKISLNDKQIAHLYMVLGGIPFYLTQVRSGLSAVQVVADLAFSKNSFLLKEFENLYATLFEAEGRHVELARTIATHRHGISQADLAKTLKSSGGTLVRWLKELEEAGFIQRFTPYLSNKKGIYYKMIDEYSLFYFKWIEPIKGSIETLGMRKEYWESLQHSPAWHNWAGSAFESICYKHVFQIMDALKVNPTAVPFTWRYAPTAGAEEDGAQIDLLFDRNDDTITVCEIKYTDTPFAIDKSYALRLNKKMEVFAKQTKTRKHLLLAFVSAHGLKPTMYTEDMVSGVCTLEDLFKNAS